MSFLDKIKAMFNKDRTGKKPVAPPITGLKPKKPKPIEDPIVTVLPPVDIPIVPPIVNVPEEDFSGVVVMLDNGHGEDTPGKCSPDKSIREYDYVRKVVKKIKKTLSKFLIFPSNSKSFNKTIKFLTTTILGSLKISFLKLGNTSLSLKFIISSSYASSLVNPRHLVTCK